MTPSPTLRTDRLLLEPYVPADEVGFVALFTDTRVSRWMGVGRYPEARCREVFGTIFSRACAPGGFDVWAVRHEGRFVGQRS
jgi:hypothetical protein